jgi:hypothetical protein
MGKFTGPMRAAVGTLNNIHPFDRLDEVELRNIAHGARVRDLTLRMFELDAQAHPVNAPVMVGAAATIMQLEEEVLTALYMLYGQMANYIMMRDAYRDLSNTGKARTNVDPEDQEDYIAAFDMKAEAMDDLFRRFAHSFINLLSSREHEPVKRIEEEARKRFDKGAPVPEMEVSEVLIELGAILSQLVRGRR